MRVALLSNILAPKLQLVIDLYLLTQTKLTDIEIIF